MMRMLSRSSGEQVRGIDRRKLRPSLESLEDRQLLYATLGDAWAYPVRITFSFVPDGTNIGGYSSNLFSTLNQLGTTAAWQLAFQKAASYWSSYANFNMAQVSDNGTILGGAGAQQGDPNFGDIRIGMTNQGANGVLASTFLPPTANGGSLAGDIVFNSGYAFKLNNDYDLQSVALHELGHSLGLDHSTDTNAAMTPYYEGVRQAPTADDGAGIAAVYGAYPSDSDTNRTINTPTNITRLMTSNGQISIGGLNLAGPSDLDWFTVTAPANTTGTMTVTMQATGLSMVSPRVAVYNSAKVGLVQFYSPTLGGNATVNITGVTAGQVYYIRASAASSPGAYGAFGLLVNFGSAYQAPIAPPTTTVLAVADRGGGGLGELARDARAVIGVAGGALGPRRVTSNASAAAVEAVASDVSGLLDNAIRRGDTSSPQYRHLVAVRDDLAGGNRTKLKADLKVILSEVVQVGGLTAYGDSFKVSTIHTGRHARKTANPSDTAVAHQTSVHHPKGVRPFVLTGAGANNGRITGLKVNHRAY